MDFSKLPVDIYPLIVSRIPSQFRLQSLRSLLQCSKHFNQRLLPCAKFVNKQALAAGLNGKWMRPFPNDSDRSHCMSGGLEGVMERHHESWERNGWQLRQLHNKAYALVPGLRVKLEIRNLPELSYDSEDGYDYYFVQDEDRIITNITNLFDQTCTEFSFSFLRYERVSEEDWRKEMTSFKDEPFIFMMCGVGDSEVLLEPAEDDGCCYAGVVDCYDQFVTNMEIVQHGLFPQVVHDEDVKNQICRKISMDCMKEKATVDEVNAAILSELYQCIGRLDNSAVECDH